MTAFTGACDRRGVSIQRARSGQSAQAAPKVAYRVRLIVRVNPLEARRGAGGVVDGEVINAEPTRKRLTEAVRA